MAKLLWREAGLILLTGLFAMYPLAHLLGQSAEWPFFLVGVMMALTFMALYAFAVLTGNKLPLVVRHWVGVIAWVSAFWSFDLLPWITLLRQDVRMDFPAHYLLVVPALSAVVLCILAAIRAVSGERLTAALSTLFAYALPMLGIRMLLVAMVRQSHLAEAIAVQGGTVYLAMRVLTRIYWPGSVEGNMNAPPLIQRLVPDRIVGLVEGNSGRRARPYVTGADGQRQETAISILCHNEEAASLLARLEQVLAGKPFEVSRGQGVGGQVEIVVSPRP